MYGFVFYLIVMALVRTIRRVRGGQPASLCTECRYAHIQYAANGRRATSCTFGGGVRAVNLDVLYCTDFCNRTAEVTVRLLGFIREDERADVACEVS